MISAPLPPYTPQQMIPPFVQSPGRGAPDPPAAHCPPVRGGLGLRLLLPRKREWASGRSPHQTSRQHEGPHLSQSRASATQLTKECTEMASMSYCRHENAASEMARVWDEWEDYEPGTSEYEDRARTRIARLVREMHEQFEFDGTYDEVSA